MSPGTTFKIVLALAALLYAVSCEPALAVPGKHCGTLSDNDYTDSPNYKPALPPAARPITTDYHHYYFFADPGDASESPCNQISDKLVSWTAQEKADVEKIMSRLAARTPGFLATAARGQKIAFCRVKESPGASAYVRTNLIVFTDFFFRQTNQYHVACHEMVHLCDIGESISDTPEWQSIVNPALKAARHNLEYAAVGQGNQACRQAGIEGVYACKSVREALADNVARYLTTGYVLTGGKKFVSLVEREILSPPQSSLDLRQKLADGYLALKAGKSTLAMQKYREVLTAKPLHALANLNVAEMLGTQGSYAQALIFLAQGSKNRYITQEMLSSIHSSQGEMLMRSGKYAQAIAAIDQGLSANEAMPDLLNYRSHCNEKLHKYVDAAQDYEESLFWKVHDPKIQYPKLPGSSNGVSNTKQAWLARLACHEKTQDWLRGKADLEEYKDLCDLGKIVISTRLRPTGVYGYGGYQKPGLQKPGF